jgi:hypothetical protein
VRRIIAALIMALSVAFLVAPATGAAAAAPARAARLLARGESGPHLRWTPQRRWAVANDWEPDVAASPTSAWVYQMTTRYGHPSTCPAAMRHCVVFRSSADRGNSWSGPVVMPRRYCPPRHSCELARWQNDPVLAVADTGVIYAIWMNARSHARVRWERRAGFRFPYGDYFGMSADGSGRYYLTWSDGASYDGPGSTWWSRSVRLR